MIERSEIVAMFREFMAEKIPGIVEAYGTDHDKLIGQVFVVERETLLIDPENPEKKKTEEFVFPIAKILNVGDHFDTKGRKFEVGGYVRLRDIDAMTIINPRHEVWVKNEFSQSNIREHQVGSAPPKILQNLWTNFGTRIFSPDPFALEWERRMSDVFYLDIANVVCPINQPEKFFEL